MLHQLNPVRVKYIRSHVIDHFGGDQNDPLPLKQFRVADVGCGGGILSEALCRIGGTMVSIDPGAANIAAAKRHAATSPVTSAIDYRCCTSGAFAMTSCSGCKKRDCLTRSLSYAHRRPRGARRAV